MTKVLLIWIFFFGTTLPTACGQAGCQSAICLNGGSCVEDGTNGSWFCDCAAYYGGQFCELAECTDLPCENGGQCYKDTTGSAQPNCDCPPGYGGDLCMLPPVQCTGTSDCQNGRACKLEQDMGGYTYCDCADGYEGAFCERTSDKTGGAGGGGSGEGSDPCDPDPCENNGNCMIVGADGQITCNCTGTGFVGAYCTVDSDPCDPNPCQNEGLCEPKTGGNFECDCFRTGYMGSRCEDPAEDDTSGDGDPPLLSQTVLIIIGAASGVVAVLIIALIIGCCCFYCRRRRKRQGDQGPGPNQEEIAMGMRYEPNPAHKIKGFNRNNLEFFEQLGSGAFAVVYRAKAKGIVKKGLQTEVAVKMLKQMSTEDDKMNFLREIEMYKNLKPHQNIIGMLGSCIDKEPYYIIMEYAKEGSLDSHLKKIRQDVNPNYVNQISSSVNHQFLTPTEIMSFTMQIARGMAYLASQKCVHRDLSARNILLGEGMVCKVSDFGLARDIYESSIYEMKTRGRVPIRWMAIESLLDNTYTSQSDVWSYGVLLWELVTLGSHPYAGMSGGEVISQLKKGYRLPKPEHCSEEMYDIMHSCWAGNPDDRPTFEYIRNKLEHMLEDAQGYLAMSAFNEHNYVYLQPDQYSLDSAPGILDD